MNWSEKALIFIFLGLLAVWVVTHAWYDISEARKAWKAEENE